MALSWLSKSVLAILLSVSLVDAAIPNAVGRNQLHIPKLGATENAVMTPNGTALPPITMVYQFDQLIDHNKPNIGTFKQRFWMNWEFYEKGGPIILLTPGETNADGFDGYLTNRSINGMIAQQEKGATVVIEHRFFGFSNPYDNLTSQSLEVLTIQQAIDDLVYFAQTIDLPMPGGDQVKPNQAHWVLIGGSYSGALTGWTMVNKPGVFRAGWASSAVVEAITNFYDLFKPIREHMPKNCSADVEAVISHLDWLYVTNNKTALQDLQNNFGLGKITHIEDFAAALVNNLYDWQMLQPGGGQQNFYRFCDALEVKDGVSASEKGWGLQNALESWGNFWNTSYYASLCGTVDAETCLGTYDATQPYYTDVSVNNAWRSWFWMMCNEVGWYQGGPPLGQPAIVSRIIQPSYFQARDPRQCVNMFPQRFQTSGTPDVQATNRKYGGWNIKVDRVFFANGLRDHWRDATLSADGLHKVSVASQPIYEGDGFHASDMDAKNGVVDASVLRVQQAGLRFMKGWLS
ncbi:hypothetical protein BV22DRAFT_1104894 [Leucogyrophana mollusca]|uniref:Uncharacterized protein n=1 Tax=Leucogyrophana mollusca TaxID=85980 RepID=A0ACB8BIK2_9AGAM|nr:hypothetical protein BV22DRAFT_1104894 [Leucogyrophana mollusca]